MTVRSTRRWRRAGPELYATKSRARRFIWIYGTIVLFAISCAGLMNLWPLSSGASRLRAAQRDAPVAQQVADVRSSLAEFQLLIEPAFATSQSASLSAVNVDRAAQLTQTLTVQTHTLVKSLPSTQLASVAHDLSADNTSYTKAYSALAPLLGGLPAAQIAAPIVAERQAFERMWAITGTAAAQLAKAGNPALAKGISYVGQARTTFLITVGLAALAALSGAFAFGQRSHRRESEERERAQRQSFASALQDALEMATNEPDVYRIVGRALRQSLSQPQVDVLVADSSNAHFQRTVALGIAGAEEPNRCGVASPVDCPAANRGHTLIFPTSIALSACPYLQDRPSGPCSAVCVPISIAGKTVGVTHAVGPDKVPPNETEVVFLEITSRRAAERVAMLRAFEESETQARSDPLTGLSNRRSLENRARDLQREGVRYALAYGDLDHFKLLNDTHGHEAGDQALRLFSRVLRDSIRPDDVAARYGGEEFVLVLPNTDMKAATLVLERIRENLARALAAGRVAHFTISFGLASSTDSETFDGVVAIADEALLVAKAAGRNRVIVASETADHARAPLPMATS